MIYQKVKGDDYRNIWAVGDLHGCYTNLMTRLEEINFDPTQDLIISVGDLIDRGTENVECMELLQMPWFKAVRGNHEQMMLDGLSQNGNVNHWMSNGGGWFFYLDYDKELLAKALVEVVRELPHVIELESGGEKIVVCHADYPSNQYEYGKQLSAEDAIWSRRRVSDAMDAVGGEILGADKFIFGHTPAQKPMKNWNQYYIDTGAVFTGNLTLMKLQGAA
ncbi:serine/threonine protein phosphatase [Pluralibacter gergoviae]|uniref:metallophosphoesterase n=1 Tax=Pluralibacter gergoviae TaxID=61647 RepID=UPI000650AD64|nr:metallophosphoesterase [Pluralibacter gergoviae]KMK17781.1 serine/threonine protein phosphatase [Pluralibacter gergoviae]